MREGILTLSPLSSVSLSAPKGLGETQCAVRDYTLVGSGCNAYEH